MQRCPGRRLTPKESAAERRATREAREQQELEQALDATPHAMLAKYASDVCPADINEYTFPGVKVGRLSEHPNKLLSELTSRLCCAKPNPISARVGSSHQPMHLAVMLVNWTGSKLGFIGASKTKKDALSLVASKLVQYFNSNNDAIAAATKAAASRHVDPARLYLPDATARALKDAAAQLEYHRKMWLDASSQEGQMGYSRAGDKVHRDKGSGSGRPPIVNPALEDAQFRAYEERGGQAVGDWQIKREQLPVMVMIDSIFEQISGHS